MFAEAALEEGHTVTVFCTAEAVHDLIVNEGLSTQTSSQNMIDALLFKGIEFRVCTKSLKQVHGKNDVMKGVQESSLGELALLMEESDRVVALNFE